MFLYFKFILALKTVSNTFGMYLEDTETWSYLFVDNVVVPENVKRDVKWFFWPKDSRYLVMNDELTDVHIAF